MLRHRLWLQRIAATTKQISASILGRWTWEVPPWLRIAAERVAATGRALRRRPFFPAALGLALIAFGVGFAWYLSRPTPHYVTFTVTDPGLTEYDDNGVPKIKPLTIAFSESAASLKLIQKTVATGISVSPAI